MPSNRVINFQCVDEMGRHILGAGGAAQINTAGSPNKATTYDINQAVVANPVALSRGQLYVQVPKANTSVDVYLAAPTGHFLVIKGLVPGDRQTVRVNTKNLDTQWVVPFSITDSVAATEKDTGFDLPVGSLVMANGMFVEVTTNEGSRTINVGTLSTESGGSANRFIAAASLASANTIKMTAAATTTYGAGVITTIATTPSVPVPEGFVVLTANPSLSYTLSASTASAKGFIVLPIRLSPNSLSSL